MEWINLESALSYLYYNFNYINKQLYKISKQYTLYRKIAYIILLIFDIDIYTIYSAYKY